MRFCFDMPEKGKLPNGRANGQKLQLFPKNSWNFLNRSVSTGVSFSDGSVLLFGLARQKASRVKSLTKKCLPGRCIRVFDQGLFRIILWPGTARGLPSHYSWLGRPFAVQGQRVIRIHRWRTSRWRRTYSENFMSFFEKVEFLCH